MREPHFREATPDDLPLLLALEESSFEDPWPEGAFAQELELPHASVWLAFEDGDAAAVGYADFWVVADEVSLLNIAVRPDRRQQGLGGRLLDLVERVGRDRGGEQVFLEVRASNEAGLALYRGRGYEQIGIRKSYYQSTGEDAVVMRRVLVPAAR